MASKRELWEGILNEWRGSGLAASAFCRTKELSIPNFHYWKRKLSAASDASEGFIELVPRGVSTPRSGIVIRTPTGFEIEARGEFDGVAFRGALRAVLEAGL